MIKKILILALLTVIMFTGCSRDVEKIEFKPKDLEEMGSVSMGKKLGLDVSKNNNNYTQLEILDALEGGELKAENVTEFSVTLPENATLNGFYMNKDVMYYAYSFSEYAMTLFSETLEPIQYTEELHTKIMGYNYLTGETKCIYEVTNPGIHLNDLQVEGDIMIWYESTDSFMGTIYGCTDTPGLNYKVEQKTLNMVTGNLMSVVEAEFGLYLMHLTSHPYFIKIDNETGIYRISEDFSDTDNIMSKPKDYNNFYFSDEVFFNQVNKVGQVEIYAYNYNGGYLYSFLTNAEVVNNVKAHGDVVAIEAIDEQNNSKLLVYNGELNKAYSFDYNANLVDVIVYNNKVYMGDFNNSGIRIFDVATGQCSSNYFGDGNTRLFYNTQKGVYACLSDLSESELSFALFNE